MGEYRSTPTPWPTYPPGTVGQPMPKEELAMSDVPEPEPEPADTPDDDEEQDGEAEAG